MRPEWKILSGILLVAIGIATIVLGIQNPGLSLIATLSIVGGFVCLADVWDNRG